MPRPELSPGRTPFLYFPPVGADPYGRMLRGAPVGFKGRVERSNVEMPGPNGQPILVDLMVSVNENIPLHSQVWEGDEVDWYGTGSAHLEGDLYEVVAAYNTPDVKGRLSRRVVGLRRYTNTPSPR